jgi:hypothetical protein
VDLGEDLGANTNTHTVTQNLATHGPSSGLTPRHVTSLVLLGLCRVCGKVERCYSPREVRTVKVRGVQFQTTTEELEKVGGWVGRACTCCLVSCGGGGRSAHSSCDD